MTLATAPTTTSGQAHTLFSVPPDGETQEWLERLRPALEMIDATRTTTEAERQSPPELQEELVRLGLTRMWVSRDLGGAQVSITTGVHVILAIAEHDPSISWQIGVQGAIGRLSDYLPEHAAEEIFGSHSDLVIGSINPTGRTRRLADGSYTLDGRWSFASGSPHARWFVAAARLVGTDGAPVVDGNGTAEIVHLFVPRSDITIHDTWQTLGLRGTASNDYTIDDVAVPADRAVQNADLLRPPPARASRAFPVAYHDFGPFTSSATALGIASDAIASFKALAREKTPMGGTSRLVDSHVTQFQLARAEAELYCGLSALLSTVRRVEEHGEDGGEPLSALVRLTAATAADRAKTAVGIINDLAGATSIYASSRLERCFRDVHTATKHLTVSPSNFEMVGQYLLGGPLAMRR